MPPVVKDGAGGAAAAGSHGGIGGEGGAADAPVVLAACVLPMTAGEADGGTAGSTNQAAELALVRNWIAHAKRVRAVAAGDGARAGALEGVEAGRWVVFLLIVLRGGFSWYGDTSWCPSFG